MILERVEQDGLIKALYESSNIVASTYDKNTKDLNIIFKHGGSYTYQKVSETDYMRFETADSQGKILNANLKKHAFLKHESVDVDDTIKQIKSIKLEESNAMALGIAELMGEILDHYSHTSTLTDVDRLTSMLAVYNKMNVTQPA